MAQDQKPMSDMTTTGAKLLVDSLAAAGIDTIFGVPGEENTAVMQALEDSGITFILTRHEQAAAFMASVHGRLTGRPAGCLSTLGPGATNLVTGVADAHLDGAPLVAITGQGARARLSKSQSHQVIDLGALFAPVTKRSQTIMTADELPGAVAEAVRLSLQPRPGAVHLSLPEDLANEQMTGRPVRPHDRFDLLPDPASVVAACDALNDAKAPIIVAGAGVIRSDAARQVRDLAEKLNIPVVTSFMAKGILPADHPLCLFSVGQPFDDHIDDALKAADLVIAIGFDPIEYSPENLHLDDSTQVIHVADVPAASDVGWNVVQDVQGSVSASLRGIVAGAAGRCFDDQPAMIMVRDALRAERDTVETDANDSVSRPEDILSRVEAQLDATDTVLSGVGLHKMKVARSLAAKRPGQIVIANGLAGMGMALPGAIAAARLPDAGHVLAICGDGDVLMNVQDMETARRLGLKMTVMVWVDGGYGLIEAKQQDETGHHTDLKFCNVDWSSLAKAFDWDHIAVDTFGALDSALSRARDAEKPVLMTLAVDYHERLRP
ncbi:acetolactate synthase large subunit [Sulfitobacter sabulilitoris]|uniref:Acetolactate synthase large subunit n=1 Tax=Sulfitobacter sabulilitoris TaxID=2562655 RepID=A0A5S3PAT2_9RHOB|nr:acetolactate synthase large subunit [Sulfitobacter sabulilitoris]TMM50606.1 acetolactate synthase large subunit [Sulfitobacter sabulilitoris]